MVQNIMFKNKSLPLLNGSVVESTVERLNMMTYTCYFFVFVFFLTNNSPLDSGCHAKAKRASWVLQRAQETIV